MVGEFEGPVSDSAYIRISVRLAHVSARIKRMALTEEDPKEYFEFKREAYATAVMLEADLEDNVTKPKDEETIDNTFVEAKREVVYVNNNSKGLDIYKWGLLFDGNESTHELYSFLERVDELSEARQISKSQLFDSAIDLFGGKARL